MDHVVEGYDTIEQLQIDLLRGLGDIQDLLVIKLPTVEHAVPYGGKLIPVTKHPSARVKRLHEQHFRNPSLETSQYCMHVIMIQKLLEMRGVDYIMIAPPSLSGIGIDNIQFEC